MAPQFRRSLAVVGQRHELRHHSETSQRRVPRRLAKSGPSTAYQHSGHAGSRFSAGAAHVSPYRSKPETAALVGQSSPFGGSVYSD
jgi:hypothetical protein